MANASLPSYLQSLEFGVRSNQNQDNATPPWGSIARELVMLSTTARTIGSAQRSPQPGVWIQIRPKPGQCAIARQALELEVWRCLQPGWDSSLCPRLQIPGCKPRISNPWAQSFIVKSTVPNLGHVVVVLRNTRVPNTSTLIRGPVPNSKRRLSTSALFRGIALYQNSDQNQTNVCVHIPPRPMRQRKSKTSAPL